MKECQVNCALALIVAALVGAGDQLPGRAFQGCSLSRSATDSPSPEIRCSGAFAVHLHRLKAMAEGKSVATPPPEIAVALYSDLNRIRVRSFVLSGAPAVSEALRFQKHRANQPFVCSWQQTLVAFDVRALSDQKFCGCLVRPKEGAGATAGRRRSRDWRQEAHPEMPQEVSPDEGARRGQSQGNTRPCRWTARCDAHLPPSEIALAFAMGWALVGGIDRTGESPAKAFEAIRSALRHSERS